MNDKPASDFENVLGDLDKALDEGIRKDTLPPLRRLSATGTLVEQIFAFAESIKEVQRDIDALQKDVIQRLEALRKRLGSKP